MKRILLLFLMALAAIYYCQFFLNSEFHTCKTEEEKIKTNKVKKRYINHESFKYNGNNHSNGNDSYVEEVYNQKGQMIKRTKWYLIGSYLNIDTILYDYHGDEYKRYRYFYDYNYCSDKNRYAYFQKQTLNKKLSDGSYLLIGGMDSIARIKSVKGQEVIEFSFQYGLKKELRELNSTILNLKDEIIKKRSIIFYWDNELEKNIVDTNEECSFVNEKDYITGFTTIKEIFSHGNRNYLQSYSTYDPKNNLIQRYIFTGQRGDMIAQFNSKIILNKFDFAGKLIKSFEQQLNMDYSLNIPEFRIEKSEPYEEIDFIYDNEGKQIEKITTEIHNGKKEVSNEASKYNALGLIVENLKFHKKYYVQTRYAYEYY